MLRPQRSHVVSKFADLAGEVGPEPLDVSVEEVQASVDPGQPIVESPETARDLRAESVDLNQDVGSRGIIGHAAILRVASDSYRPPA